MTKSTLKYKTKLFRGNLVTLFVTLGVSALLLISSLIFSRSNLIHGFFGILVVSIVYQIFLGFFDKHWDSHHGINALLVGFIFTALSFIIALILFRHNVHLVGLTTVFFSVILTVPVFNHVLSAEETLERKKGHFFKKNETIIDFYLYFFIGVFLFFLLLSFIEPSLVFSKNDFYNIQTSENTLKLKLPPPAVNDFQILKEIIYNNLFIVFVTFLLSLVFGAGSIYLIVLNASMSAAAISGFALQRLGGNAVLSFLCNWSVFSLHLIPEMLGFLIAALAGGILLMDFKKEKLFSKNFDEVSLDSILLLLLAAATIVIAGLIEVFLSGKLISGTMCAENPATLISIFAAIIVVTIWFEHHRKTHPKFTNRKS